MVRLKTHARLSKIVLSSLLVLLLASCVPIAQESLGGKLLIGLVVHLEGWPLSGSEDVLERYEDVVLDYADLFERYGAKLTWETINTVDAILKYGGRHNFLLELQQRGHAVGVHADLGGRPGLTYPEFVATQRQMRENQESLGINVRHVSGTCSYLDWVSAAIEAGFEFTTSGVAFCYSAVEPPSARPEEYRDCASPAACHQFIPEELAQRISPWRVSDVNRWLEDDSDGELVIFPSSGTINCFAEERGSQESVTSCELTQQDIDLYIEELEAALALALAQPDRVNTYYVVWSLGGQLNQDLLERWLQAIEPYVESGLVGWATLHEMMDAYQASR